MEYIQCSFLPTGYTYCLPSQDTYRMASRGEESQKWKRKRMLRAKAEKMRAMKKARSEEAEHDDTNTHNQDMGREGPSVPQTAEEEVALLPPMQ